MAAAYAALVSLSNVLHQILNPPPTHHFEFPRERVESLQDTVVFLIKFLESQRSQEIEDVEARILDAAHAAEDIIESDVVAQIQKEFADLEGKKLKASIPIQVVLEAFHQPAASQAIEDLISIQEVLTAVKSTNGVVEDARRPENSTSSSSSDVVTTGGKNFMVGFGEHLNQIKSDLSSGGSERLILPIVGMGGIGKSTLASNVFTDPYIIDYFEICAWVSVSQEYKEREIVLQLLKQINSTIDGSGVSTNDLGVRLHKELIRGSYLIVLDDLWEIQAWDKVRKFLPENGKRSRILVTTRNFDLATSIGSLSPHEMSLLDEDRSWDLIHEYVKDNCPLELVDIGKNIARGCRGLPLALVVIGGLLARSEKTRDFWAYVEENVTSTVNNANDEQCLNVLRLSYSQLPLHLKPCFLYLAAFPKHVEIRMSRVVRLWVAEGLVRPRDGRSLEEVAQGYLKDLCDRNLIMISKRGRSGKVKNYNIHDVVRDLCVAEAHNNNFLRLVDLDNPKNCEIERRLSIHTCGEIENKASKAALKLGKQGRSLLSYSAWESSKHVAGKLNLLRVLDVADSYSVDEIIWLTNLRYITCAIPRDQFHLSSLLSLLWSIQSIVLPGPVSLPHEVWLMRQLRHVKIPGITLANPLQNAEGDDDRNEVVLENLQTLTSVRDFIFSKRVLRRIPNLKKLGIDCETSEGIGSFYLRNLALFLNKLESLVLKCRGVWENMALPISLRKLTLSHCQIPWEDMSMVGSLPNLEVLKLRKRAAKGRTWSPNEGEFRRLKFLLIDWCQLEIWEADDTHFPNLEHLQLVGVKMEEFPLAFAEIASLGTIDFNYCNEALLKSAKAMAGERGDFDFDDIQIRSFPNLEAPKLSKKNPVHLEDEAEKLIGYLLEESEEFDVISIVGQRGLGKTTLAEKIFYSGEINSQFPACIWITASEGVSARIVFLFILRNYAGLNQETDNKSDLELAELTRTFFGYSKVLLVLDDLCTCKDWDRIRVALPRKSNRGGKVLITSREIDVCQYANPSRDPHELRVLTREESWLLLQLEVYGKPEFPAELEVEGKLLADRCRGLPLAVLFVAGILKKKLSSSDEMKPALEEASESLNADLDLGSIPMPSSYEKLPHHLNKCFMYAASIFPEDYAITTWKLILMWIGEGYVQKEDDISLEETGEKYLNDLISSNLLRAYRLNAEGKVKTCTIPELLRFLCFRKAMEETDIFLQKIQSSLSKGSILSGEHKYERIGIHSNVMQFLSSKPSYPNLRSFVCCSREDFRIDTHTSVVPRDCKQLRVLDVNPLKITKLPTGLYKLLHLRYLVLSIEQQVLPVPFSRFKNIQTLIINTTLRRLNIQVDILNMIELRHFKTNAAASLCKPGGRSGGGENIQTLGMISPESCTHLVFNRVPHIKKLRVRGNLALLLGDKKRSVNSLGKLENLETLDLISDVFPKPPSEGRLLGLPPADTFPIKLRSLTLRETLLDWRHMSNIGSLENLEILKLKDNAFRGKTWETTDGGFLYLQTLCIDRTDLEMWVASDHHFPKLKSLTLRNCEELVEVPVGLADAPNFQRLDLYRCRRAVASARKIEAKKRDAHPFHLSIFPPDH